MLTPQTLESTLPTIKALTSLRFFAALHVIIFHMTMTHMDSYPAPIRIFLLSSPISVVFFFVLSGFILTYNYVREDQPRVDSRSFWGARFARIYPIYLISLAIGFPVLIRESIKFIGGGTLNVAGTVVGTALLDFFGLQSWYPPAIPRLNPPAWSLSVEAFFYLLFPFLANHLKRLRIPSLLYAGSAMWMASLIAPFFYLILNPDGIGAGTTEGRGYWLNYVTFMPIFRLPEFVIGMVAGRLFQLRTHNATLAGVSRSIHGHISLLLILIAISVNQLIPFPLLHNGLFAPLFAYFIVSVAASGGFISKFISIPIVVGLGEASYSMFILHSPIERWVRKIASLFGFHDESSLLYYALWGAIALLVAVAAFHFIEEPARKAIRAHMTARGSRRISSTKKRLPRPATV